MHLRLVALLLLALVACDDDTAQPESVPFEGLDPSVQPKRPDVLEDPKPEPSASASAKPVPVPSRSAGRLSACCAALSAMNKTSPDPTQRAAAASAARVCFTKLSEVKQGAIKTETALSQVRSAILGKAPSACR